MYHLTSTISIQIKPFGSTKEKAKNIYSYEIVIQKYLITNINSMNIFPDGQTPVRGK